MPDEATRAAEHRRRTKARARAKRTVEAALKGDATARAALEVKTKPLLVIDEDGVRRGDVQ